MATLKSQDYNSLSALVSRNEYIVDGHGEPTRNEYITDGHGLSTLCAGYNCADDPDIASQEMMLARAKYYASHQKTKGTNKQKRPVEMTQFYLSFTEEEKLSEQQMMDIARELIEKTDLKEFICFYAPHRNTENYHVHISVGAYQKDGERKLSMNSRKMYRYRAELDRIVASRGLTIIEPTKAMRYHEPEHAQWLDENRDSLTVLPLLEGKKESERMRYRQAKEREREKQAIEERERLHRQLYRRHYIYLPKRDTIPLLLVKLALATAGLYTPEVPYSRSQRNGIKRDWAIQHRMDAIAFARESGITSTAGFYEQKLAIGQRMNRIKKAIYQLEKRADELAEPWSAYCALSNEDTKEEAQLRLQAMGYKTMDDLWALYDRVDIIQKQFERLNAQLEEEKRAYRKTMSAIKSVEKVMYDTLLDRGYKPPENRKISLDSRISRAEQKKKHIQKEKDLSR